jgi:aspartate kinase
LDRKQQEKGDIPLLLTKLGSFADVTVVEDRAIVSIICNTDRSSEVMALAFQVVNKLGIRVEMLSQGASKVNIGMVIPMKDKELLISTLHACFFEGKLLSEI